MTDLSTDEIHALLAAATPGPWHHCQPFKTAPAVRTIHGPVPAQRIDYVSTWPHLGRPKGHRIIVPMEGNPANVRSEDMALIAHLPDLAAEVIRLRAECFALAAGACGGHYGDDYGNSRCSLVDVQRTRAEAAEALLREAGEMLLIVASSLEEEIEARRAGELPRRIERDLAEVAAARDLAAKIDAALEEDHDV